MGIVNDIFNSFRFKDTIFYKSDSDLQERFDALTKLNKEYPSNNDVLSELYIVKKGLEGEKEISYQLQKANIGMYVLHDVKVKYGDLTAQIDYIVITSVFIYFIECKNLIGNITVNENGDFIREYTFNGKKIKKGMYSPLRQVEAQREVIRKIWESKASGLVKLFGSKNFDYYRKVLVVVANQETILNISKAPKDIKSKVLRADALVRKIQYDLCHIRSDDSYSSKKNMELIAQSYANLCINENIDYYKYYKDNFCKNNISDNLKERLVELRKARSTEMKLPAYYVFTNDELDKLVELRPKTMEELKSSNILTPIKIKTHGEFIIEEISKGKNIK